MNEWEMEMDEPQIKVTDIISLMNNQEIDFSQEYWDIPFYPWLLFGVSW